MLLAVHVVKLLLIPIHRVKLYAHTDTWSEALCSLLYME